MKKTLPTIPPPPFEAIHARAYHLWQHANRPTGQDMNFWLQAEQHVMQQPQASAAAATTPAKAPSTTKTAARTSAKTNPQTAPSFRPKSAAKRSTKAPVR